MRVCLLFVMLADEALNVGVRGTLPVLHGHVLTFKDGKTYLKVLGRLLIDLPHFAHISCLIGRVNVDPHVNDSLIERAAHVVQLTSLNRLLIDGLPLRIEESVVEVN